MVVRKNSYPIGTYLVGDVSVRGDSISSDDDEIDHSLTHKACRHVVANYRHRHARTGKLPARESRTLAHRTRLVGEDALDLALLGGGIHHAERCAEKHGGKASRVAVRKDASVLGDESRPRGADCSVHLLILSFDAKHLVEEGVGHLARCRPLRNETLRKRLHVRSGPHEVHRRRARRRNLSGNGPKRPQETLPRLGASVQHGTTSALVHRPKCHGGSPRSTDGRGSAHRERLYGIYDATPAARRAKTFLTR